MDRFMRSAIGWALALSASATMAAPALQSVTQLGDGAEHRAVCASVANGALFISGDRFAANDYEGLIARYELPIVANASPTWSRTWPMVSGWDRFECVVATAEGVYVAGESEPRARAATSSNETKGVVVKFPLSGVGGASWARQTPPSPGAFAYGGSEALNGITTMVEGGRPVVYAVGQGQANAANACRFFISKLDTLGNVAWTRTDEAEISGNGCTTGNAAATLDGHIYAAGSDADDRTSRPSLRKYDGAGNLAWARKTLDISGRYLGITAFRGAVYAVGSAGEEASGDLLIEKWNADGSRAWSRSYVRAGAPGMLRGIVALGDVLYAVGSTRRTPDGTSYAIILEIDPASGDVLSTTLRGGGIADEIAYSAATDGVDLYVVGEVRNVGSGPSDAVILRYAVSSKTAQPISARTLAADFPGSCQIPLGWSIPPTATVGWHVATDSASEGACSLKSDALPGAGRAQIQFTGYFNAGNVVFDRRVSSEYFFDCLKLFVDGVQQNLGMACASGGSGLSGEAAWGSVSIPVTAGLHTLLWSYQKDSTVNAGADAAWIDDVALPLAATGSPASIVSSPPANAAINRPYTHAIITQGDPAPTFLLASGSLPPGLSLDPVTGFISGTPVSLGTFTGTIRASNFKGESSQGFSIAVLDDDFPLHCQFPELGSTDGWGLATDWSAQGPCSLKSGPVADFGTSQFLIEGDFQAGNLEFAWRVSSQAGFDCLRLFIDGIEAFGAACGASGEQSGFVFFAIDAGIHRFTWSYEKNGSVSAGSDAAWIDNVVLPPLSEPCPDCGTGPQRPRFVSGPPPNGAVAVEYAHQFFATSNSPVQYSLSSGSFPPGLSLDPLNGFLGGTPTIPGIHSGIVSALNIAGQDDQAFSITIRLSDEFAFSSIWAGNLHTCARTAVAGLKCWGDNQVAQLGDGTVGNYRAYPYPAVGLTNGIASAGAGAAHSCARTGAGGVLCWGSNTYGQLGDGSTTQRLQPVETSGFPTGVSAIAVGDSHTCALTTAGGVKCWGRNDAGQVGDNSTTHRTLPTDVAGLASGVIGIAAGAEHTCAITSAGNVKCWGSKSHGQLGDNTTTTRLIPTTVTSIAGGFTGIAAGGNHSCVIASGGALWCWGSNANGELGDNSTTQRLTPVSVSGLSSGVASVTAGARHTCAKTTTGGAKCWGSNDAGQVGDGTPATRRTPRDVANLTSGVTGIAAGGSHTCAVLTTGVVDCWGLNSRGQLGDGTTVNKSLAAPVVFPRIPGMPTITGFDSGDGQLRIHFALADDGGAPILRYNATVDWTISGGQHGNAKQGLRWPITFSVPDGADFHVTLTATNAAGTGPQATGSGHAGRVPGTPAIASVSQGGNQCQSDNTVRIVFSSPTSPGSAPIDYYVITAEPGGIVGTAVTSPAEIANLGFNQPYRFRASAVNSYGQGPPSLPSDEIVLDVIACSPARGSGSSISVFSNSDGTSEIAFTTQRIGTASEPQYVTFKDSGEWDGMTLVREPSPPQRPFLVDGPFTVSDDCGTFDGSCTIAIRFAPQSTGAHTSILTILDARGKSYDVNVGGWGVSPPGQVEGLFATPGDSSATVVFAPAFHGESPPVSYVTIVSPGGRTVAGDSPVVVDGLTNGTTYTFTVVAHNDHGDGPPSLPSNPVTPFGSLSQLSVGRAGNGDGTVASNPPGIYCGASCSAAYSSGSTVVLNATPVAGYVFSGWNGCDAPDGSQCTMTVSASRNVTASFSAPVALALTDVVSRKAHGAGTFDLPVDATQPIGGAVSIEPRAIGSGHRIVFQFNAPVSAPGTPACVDASQNNIGAAAAVASGNEVVVTLTGIPNASRARVSLANVNGTLGAAASIGFLLGDVNGTRSVTASDILRAKGRLSQAVTNLNAVYDADLSATVDAADVTTIRQGAGMTLP